ncbi:MAG: hypothetical protein ABSE87_06080 [Terracidiphilus sp.]
MSSFAISGITSSNAPQVAEPASAGTVQNQAAQAAVPTAVPAASSLPEDTVTLSVPAQAQQMYQSGDSVSTIATSLGTSVSTVDSYLGVADATAVPLKIASGGHGAPAKTAEPAAPAASAPAASAPAAPTATSEPAKVAVKG